VDDHRRGLPHERAFWVDKPGKQYSGNAVQIGEAATTAVAMTGITVSVTDHGGNGAHNNMPSFVLGTWFLKL